MPDLQSTNGNIQSGFADLLGHARACPRWSVPARKTGVGCACIAWKRAEAALIAADEPLRCHGVD